MNRVHVYVFRVRDGLARCFEGNFDGKSVLAATKCNEYPTLQSYHLMSLRKLDLRDVQSPKSSFEIGVPNGVSGKRRTQRLLMKSHIQPAPGNPLSSPSTQ